MTERLKKTFSTAVFDRLAIVDPNYMSRIHVINGDVGERDLGISAADVTELSENVEIVLHVAANVRFDCSIDTICLVNVRGTREMIKLVRQFKLMTLFVYISTAYCQSTCLNSNTKEEFYPAPMDPHEMIRICEYFEALPAEHCDRDQLATITAKFMSPWPNTYSFSKAITEELIRQAGTEFPIVVVRPSIG